MTNTTFRNANEAYEYLHDKIIKEGIDFGDTKALFNVGFYITKSVNGMKTMLTANGYGICLETEMYLN